MNVRSGYSIKAFDQPSVVSFFVSSQPRSANRRVLLQSLGRVVRVVQGGSLWKDHVDLRNQFVSDVVDLAIRYLQHRFET
jgi:hypothetical protein